MKFFILLLVSVFTTVMADVDSTHLPLVTENKEQEKDKVPEIQETTTTVKDLLTDMKEPIPDEKPILPETNVEVKPPATEMLPPKVEKPVNKFSSVEINTFKPIYLKDYFGFPLRQPLSFYNQRYDVPYSMLKPLPVFQNFLEREYLPRINFPFVATNVEPFYDRPSVDYSYMPLPYNRLVIEPQDELKRQPLLDDIWQYPYEYVYSSPSAKRFLNLF